MKLNRKRLAIVGALVVVAGVLVFRMATRSAHAGNEDPSVQTAAVVLVERGSIVNTLTLSGVFRPFQEVDVHAKVAGYIKQIFVDVGDKVKEGQTLAILEVPELNAEVLGAGASVRRGHDAIT